MKFLTAKWKDLVFINYEIDPTVLEAYVPNGTSVDLFQGRAYLSLVAFRFNQTKVFGLPLPLHSSFPEVNLRFYIKPDYDPSIRAVCFIKEIVPKRMVTFVANTFFGENYHSEPMTSKVDSNEYLYRWGKKLENVIEVKSQLEEELPKVGSLNEFISEHYFGYSKKKDKTYEYEVEHPKWTCRESLEFNLSVDFEKVYGEVFGFLSFKKPESVFVADGSEVAVSAPRKLVI